MADAATRATEAWLTGAVARRVAPAVAAEVGDSAGPLWSGAFGTLTFDADALPCQPDTIFDLASLTKPVATATLVMDLAARRHLAIEEPVALSVDEWRGDGRDVTTLQDLLEHASGLAARLVDPPPSTRREFEHEICAMPLEYEPRRHSIYSDLGFILLGFIVEDRGGGSLGSQFDRLMARFRVGQHADEGVGAFLGCAVPADERGRTAPTLPLDEDRRRGRRLVGEVHDNYAAAVGGVAGHAGLFGTADALGRFARAVLAAARGDRSHEPPFTPALVGRMTTKSGVPGSSRALGWDTMLPTSSCGTELSPAAFGHVGFTGTSLWIDPILDRYFVLLSNRVCGGGTLDDMREVRRGFHDRAAAIGF